MHLKYRHIFEKKDNIVQTNIYSIKNGYLQNNLTQLYIKQDIYLETERSKLWKEQEFKKGRFIPDGVKGKNESKVL